MAGLKGVAIATTRQGGGKVPCVGQGWWGGGTVTSSMCRAEKSVEYGEGVSILWHFMGVYFFPSNLLVSSAFNFEKCRYSLTYPRRGPVMATNQQETACRIILCAQTHQPVNVATHHRQGTSRPIAHVCAPRHRHGYHVCDIYRTDFCPESVRTCIPRTYSFSVSVRTLARQYRVPAWPFHDNETT